MKGIIFTEEGAKCNFKEAEELENIKSGESVDVIFGKIQRWFSELGICITEEDLKNALKDLPQRYYDDSDSIKGVDLTPNPELLSPTNNCSAASGNYSIVSGIKNNAAGDHSIAVGDLNKALGNYSVSMGYSCTVNGEGSIAIGVRTNVQGNYSAAMGYMNNVPGNYSNASGYMNNASGDYSVASGCKNNALGIYSVAMGRSNIANSDYQTVFGKYNTPDIEDKFALIVGNGTSDENRSNGLTLDWDGNLWTAGDITATNSDGERISLRSLQAQINELKSQVAAHTEASTNEEE